MSLIIYLKCIFVDPVLIISAAMGAKSFFSAPVEKRNSAQLAKRSFCEHESDELAVVKVAPPNKIAPN